MQDRQSKIKCPICRNHGKKIFEESVGPYTFRLEKCSACSMLFVNPRLINIENAGYNDNVSQYTKNHLGKFKTKVFNDILNHMEYFRQSNPYLLDLGAGLGYFPYLASKRGYIVKGLELSPPMIQYAKEIYGVELLRANLMDEINLPSESFNFVTALDVFEHLIYPLNVLKKIYRLLEPGGLLVLRYPNGLQTILKCRLLSGIYKKYKRPLLCSGGGGTLISLTKKQQKNS